MGRAGPDGRHGPNWVPQPRLTVHFNRRVRLLDRFVHGLIRSERKPHRLGTVEPDLGCPSEHTHIGPRDYSSENDPSPEHYDRASGHVSVSL